MATGEETHKRQAGEMLCDLHRRFAPLRGGLNGVPTPVRLHRVRGCYVLVITRYRWEMDPRFFMGRSAAAAIEKAWKATKP